MQRRGLFLLLAIGALMLARVGAANGQTLAPDFAVLDVAPSATLHQPVAIAFAPDGRLFVAERRGRVVILAPDANPTDARVDYSLLDPPFLEIESDVLFEGERGLLGLALDPDFASNGHVYVFYVAETNPGNPDVETASYSRVERVTASVADPNVADPATRVTLIGETWATGITSTDTSHSSGTLVFGDDGTLLVSHGDGAHFDMLDIGGNDADSFLPGRSDPLEDVGAFRAQYLGSMSGKVLRIDPATGDGIPSNPFYETLAPRSPQSRIWARGLRNPYRMDLQRGSGSTDPTAGNPGRLGIADVGWNTAEEVNLAWGGENFGWPCYEGLGPHYTYQAATPMHSGCSGTDEGMTYPLVSYPHAGSTLPSYPLPGLIGNASVGATFHAGTNYPLLYRNLLYIAEFTQGWIRGLRLDDQGDIVEMIDLADGLALPVELRVDPYSGDLFTISYITEKVQRIAFDGPDGVGTAPAQPQGLVAIPGNDRVTLHWQFNPEVDLAGYHVYRASSTEGPWEALTVAPIEAREFVDDGSVLPLTTGQEYWYAIEAVDTEVPARTSPFSEAVVSILTSKTWEWYTPNPNVTLTLDTPPSQFPKTLALGDPGDPNFDHWTTADRAPQLRRTDIPNGDFVLETRLDLLEYVPFKSWDAGLVVGFGQYDALIWGFHLGTNLQASRSGISNLGSAANSSPSISLRLRRVGSQFIGEYRAVDSDPWSFGFQYTTSDSVRFAGTIVKTWEPSVPFAMRIERLGIDELPPVAGAVASPLSGAVPLSVEFTSNSYDPDGDMVVPFWNFGDGTVSSSRSTTHVYSQIGRYPVTLTVLDACGFADSADTLWIDVTGNTPPTAQIVSPLDGFEFTDPTLPITLAGLGSDGQDPPDSLAYSWSVDLRHGATFTPGYLSPAEGDTSSFVPNTTDDGQGITLDVILTVTDRAGASATDTVTVVDAVLPRVAQLDLRAALSNGVSAPTVPGRTSPWVDLVAPTTNAGLAGFEGTSNSGWQGSGTYGDPYRLQFDGIDDVVAVAAGALGSFEDGATVELWFRTPLDVQRRGYVLEWLETYFLPFAGCTLAIEDGELRLFSGGWIPLIAVEPLEWVHLILVKRPGDWQAYVDGTLVASGDASNLGAQNSMIVFGASTYAGPNSYSSHFSGALAEVRIHDRALNPANVQVAFAQPAPLYADAPLLLSSTPGSAPNDGSVTLTVIGRRIAEDATFHLRRTNEEDLAATAFAFATSESVQVDFDLAAAAPGTWDLLVTNPDGLQEILASALSVGVGNPPSARLSLTMSDSLLAAGEVVAVALDYDDLGSNFGFHAATMTVEFPADRLRLLSVEPGAFLLSEGAPAFVAADSTVVGRVRLDVALLGDVALQGAGTLLTLAFEAGTTDASGTVAFAEVSALDASDPPAVIPTLSLDASFRVDATPPSSPFALMADAREGGVLLNWTLPDSEAVGTTVFLRPWSSLPDAGYPEYDDDAPAPPWPSTVQDARDSVNGWTELTLTETADLDHAVGTRTVMSAVLLARDAAGNLSSMESAPRVRVPSYRLGDFGRLAADGSYESIVDGRVDGREDLPLLSRAYGSSHGGPQYFAAADIGPTNDGTPDGVPATDNVIDFEDLMIFAQDFGPGAVLGARDSDVVLGASTANALRVAFGAPTGDSTTGAAIEIPLLMTGNEAGVKGLHLELSIDPARVAFEGFDIDPALRAGPTIAFVDPRRTEVIVLDLAVLGRDRAWQGDGALGTLRLRLLGGLGGSLEAVSAEARGRGGQRLTLDAEALAREGILPRPRTTRLLPARPNPFNPRTALHFEIAEPDRVSIRIFDVAGRLVRTLIDGSKDAGYHVTDWDGTDGRGQRVGSGVYMGVLQTGRGTRSVQKLTLLK